MNYSYHPFPGTFDSSGMRLWYTTTPRQYDAGIFSVGHFVHTNHVIPPNSQNFVSTGLLPEDCSKSVRNFAAYVNLTVSDSVVLQYIPEGGIHVFANFFHTHLAGRFYSEHFGPLY